MKAIAVFANSRQVKLVDHPEPGLDAPHDVKMRMLDVGVCGTDREIASFEYGTPPQESDYLVLGHEALGEVVEVGPQVSRVRAGDLVVPMVRRPCPHESCTACRADRQDFCFSGDFTERGIKEAHGFMTEFVVDQEKNLIPLPATLRGVGVLVEPLTIAEKALEQVWDIQERLPWGGRIVDDRMRTYRHSALVLGAGAVGLLGAMAVAAAGFETFVFSREKPDGPRARIVQSIGARFLSAQEVEVADLPRLIDGIDLVYEATGASRLCFEVMKVLGTNGVFCFTGVPGRKAPVEVDTALIMRNLVLKNQAMLGTVNAGREAYEAAVRDLGVFVQRWPDAVRGLITGRFAMERHGDLLEGHVPGIKSVIEVG